MAYTLKQQIEQLYIAWFNRVPDVPGLDYWYTQVSSGKATLSQVNASFASTPEAQASYPSFLSNAQFVDTIFLNVLERNAEPDAIAWLAGLLDAGKIQRNEVISVVLGVANTQPGDMDTLANKILVSDYAINAMVNGAVFTASELETFVDGVNGTAASVASAKLIIDSAGATDITLTTGVDNVVGTANADNIYGVESGVAATDTFSALDVVDGAGGNDTLSLSNTDGTMTIGAATVKNVENLVARSAQNAVTADVQTWSGLQSVKVEQLTGAAVTVTTKSNVTSVTAAGGTVTVTDNGSAATTADTVATVVLTGTAGATIGSDALTSLSIANSAGGATVNAAAATRGLTVNLNNVSGGTVSDITATSLKINAAGAKTTAGTVQANAAKDVTIFADEKLTLTQLNVAAATSLVVTGDSLVTVGGGSAIAALTSIDASKQSAGGLDISANPLGISTAATVAFQGGAGKDKITVSGTTKAITMGDGNDSVALIGTALGAGGSVDAGAGTQDTLAFTSSANATAATANGNLAATISNFEAVALASASGSAVTLNLANLDNIANVAYAADIQNVVNIQNLASGGVLALATGEEGTVNPSQTTTTTNIDVTNAAVGTSDSIIVYLSDDAQVLTGGLNVANVETVTYLTDDSATTPTGIQHGSNLAATSVKTINVAGDAGLNLANVDTTVTTFDASGVTKGAVTWTTGALAAAATIKGGAGANTVDATAATKAVTYTGSAGVDTITINNAQANVINTNAGNDVIVVGSGANTVNAGDGNDTITVGASAGLTTINVGAGTDTVVLGAIQTAAGFYTSVTGMGAGDSINLAAVGTVAAETTLGAKITLGSASSFANYLDAAVSGAATGAVNWFQFNSNTYVTVDNDPTSTFADGVDTVIELVGVVDLSTSSVAGEILTLA